MVCIVQQVPKTAHEGVSNSKVSETTLLRLPDEILLHILSYALTFSNGIHGDRWPLLKQARVDKLALVNRKFLSMTPEALYASNKVIVKPAPPKRQSISGADVRTPSDYERFCNRWCLLTTYPTVKHSHWVSKLEYSLNLAWTAIHRRTFKFKSPG
jgi:hypothetical protein